MVDTEFESDTEDLAGGAKRGKDELGEKGEVEAKESIGEGLESCVGHTPLFRIKSLSQETGCEVLGKAEFMNGGGGSPKDRVALGMIRTVCLLSFLGRRGAWERWGA